MNKKIFIIIAFVLLLICSNLLGDLREVTITVLPYDGDVHDCYIYLNSYAAYMEKVDETCNGEDIAELRTDPVIYNLAYGDGGIVTFPTIVHIELDDVIYPNSTTRVWCQGNVGFYFPDQSYFAIGSDIIQYDQASVEVTSTSYPPAGYTYRTTTLSSSGWNWVSFPVMDPDYSDPIQHVLAPILGNLEEVRHNVPFEDLKRIYWDGYNWQNEIGDFRSIDGYKIKMNNNADLELAGWWENPETQIPLYAEVDKAPWPPPLGDGNWIGYFIPGSQSCRIAFAQIWDKITFIKADDWAYINGYSMDPPLCTVDCGKLYIVGVSEDCSLIWQGIGQSPVDPYIKPQTEVFSYEEKADYMPIFVDSTEAVAGIDEIGVFIDDECISASKIEGFPVFIPAYIDEDSTGSKDYNELTFQIATYGKSGKRSISAFVYNEMKDAFVKEPIILDNNSYAIVRLGTEEVPEIPVEFYLYQNYPNPIRTSTTISFSTPELTDNAEIQIYNVKGQLVKTLLPTTTHQLAIINVYWNGTDENGNQLSNGIYFYKLNSGEKTSFKKMILLR